MPLRANRSGIGYAPQSPFHMKRRGKCGFPTDECATLPGMASVALNRPDLFPPGTDVELYPARGLDARVRPDGEAVAHGPVGPDGWFRLSDDRIVRLTRYIAYAEVGSEHRRARLVSRED